MLYAALDGRSGTLGPIVEGTSYLSGPGVGYGLRPGLRQDMEQTGGLASLIRGTSSGAYVPGPGV